MRTTSNAIGPLVVALSCVGMAVAPSGMAQCQSHPVGASQGEPNKEKPAEQQVSGTVADRDGAPVERAQVLFDGPKKATLLTDAAGHFSFTGPPGEYAITVRKGDRSASFTRTVEGNQLKPDATLRIDAEEPQ